eukprot:425296_1
MASQSDDRFAISVRVTSIEKPQDYKKDTNYTCKISIETTNGKWSLNRSFKDFEIFHANLVINESFRGLNFPKIPARKGSVANIDDYLSSKQNEYSQYLSEILHRSILLGNKDILDFIQGPEKVRRAAKKVMEREAIPVKSGQMKKEGEKWKGYRSRFFVLLPNYLLQYYETADAYQIGIQCKGSIDLTLATKILVYDKTSNPYSMGIKTPNRIWKLQCDTESERDEWVQSLRNLLQNPSYTGYIMDYNDYKNRVESGDTGVQVETTEVTELKDNFMDKSKIDEQDEQIVELNQRMQSLINKQNVQTEQLKDEIANEYKQQLDLQRETMTKWKEKIQELSQEIVNIEQERQETDLEYKNKIEELESKITEQEKEITDKDLVITKAQDDVKLMGTAISKLQKEALFRKNKMNGMNDILIKVQGDSISKLKYNKQSKKFVIFTDKINHLFYYDENGPKYIIIRDISITNDLIQKQMNKPWFLVIGDKRSALFAADNITIRDKWVNFIKQSIHKQNYLMREL